MSLAKSTGPTPCMVSFAQPIAKSMLQTSEFARSPTTLPRSCSALVFLQMTCYTEMIACVFAHLCLLLNYR